MNHISYLRGSSFQQINTLMALALVISLSLPGSNFMLAESMLVKATLYFCAAVLALYPQITYPQSYASRLAWIFVSVVPVVWAIDAYPFFIEASASAAAEKLGDESLLFRQAQWNDSANILWLAFMSIMAVNLLFAAYKTISVIAYEVRNGVDHSVDDSSGNIDFLDNVFGDEIWRIGLSLAGIVAGALFGYILGYGLSEGFGFFAAFVILGAYFGYQVGKNIDLSRNGPNTEKPAAVAPPRRVEEKQDYLSTRDTEALRPKLTFADLAGQDELKQKLLAAANEWKNNGKMNGKNGIFLYGVPGTGKTAFAEALAGELKLRIMKVNIGSIASRWVNQTTEQLQQIIDSALRQAPCVLFLDEAEAIFPDRSRIERGDSEESKVVGSFLSSIDKLRAGRVLVIAATNYNDRVDEAVIRVGRFDFSIEVTVPDFEARKGLVLNTLKKAGKTVEPAVLDRLARRWAGFNVPRIQEATRRAAGFAARREVGMADFMRGLRDVQGNNTGVPETALGLSDLYFDDDLKKRLEALAATFVKSDEIEARGGSIPKGVIFYGPPGTGKTTMAMALAKASGWAFIATNGKEILSDSRKLAEIRRKASDLRPAIVFIDEADDILGDRRMSGLKLHTSDLLATINGAGEPMHDVVWILATNDIDSFDEAVIRRFPTKIELPVPGIETLTRMVRDWAAKRADMIPGDAGAWSAQVAAALEGLAPSVVQNILDSALNTEAANSVLRSEPMSITLEEVLKARREMRV